MSVKPVNLNLETSNGKKNTPKKNVAFGNGGGNPIVTIMDAVDRGGYIAAFIVQDGCGFIGPRVLTGLNRNKEETHEYNWKFAATEAIREFLSGPSMIAIPFAMLWFVKKKFGTANDVPIKYISSIGDDFANFVTKQNASKYADKEALRKAYYTNTMKNILRNATNGELSEKELNAETKYFTDKIFEIEKAPKKPGVKKFVGARVEGSSYDMLNDLADRFTALNKKYGSPTANLHDVKFTTISKDGKEVITSAKFQTFLKHIKNYTDDAIGNVTTKFKGTPNEIGEFMKKFNSNRIKSRFWLIVAMDVAVAAFLSIVPKLYKHKDGNPGLVGLDVVDNSKPLPNEKKEGK